MVYRNLMRILDAVEEKPGGKDSSHRSRDGGEVSSSSGGSGDMVLTSTDVNALGLFFEISIDHFGQERTIPLLPGGSSIPLTYENRQSYVHLVAAFHLDRAIAPQTRAFLRGFKEGVCQCPE